MNQNEIGKHIEELRKKKGLTQKELGEKLGLSNTAISKWECGCNLPDISMLGPLSEVLGVDMMDLINPASDTLSKRKRHHKKKPFFLFNIIIFILLIILLILIVQNLIKVKESKIINLKTPHIFEITSADPSFYINGYLIYNDTDNCFILNKIKYQDPSIGTDEELVAKEVNIYITIDGDIVYRFNYNFKKKPAKQLNELFDEIVTNQTKPSISDVNINKYTNELDKMDITIIYKSNEKESDELNVKLTATEEFTI